MIEIVKVLRRAKLLTFSNLLLIAREIFRRGVNIGLLTRVASVLYTKRTAIVYNQERISYDDLFEYSKRFASILSTEYQLKQGNRIAIACTNHPVQIYSILAAGYLGMDIFLLPSDLKANQLQHLVSNYNFDFVVYDEQLEEAISEVNYQDRSLVSYAHAGYSVYQYLLNSKGFTFACKRHFMGKVIVLTAGTTGTAKVACRKVSAKAFLSPFVELLKQLELYRYASVCITTPIYHGFGISTLFVSLLLGQRIYISNKFNLQHTLEIIRKEQIQCITLVPTILQRLINQDFKSLSSLQCIVSGGAPLPSSVVKNVQNNLGDILYNLYGTSEAGLCMLATPEDLKYNLHTIGKPIANVQTKIKPVEKEKYGELSIKCEWSSNSNDWIDTGDLAYSDTKGYFFLKGRIDDMIVSGGENVYPMDIESCLLTHPLVKEAAAVGVSDQDFGQRLNVFVVSDKRLDEDELRGWLSMRLARYQMPRDIIFVSEIPKTPIGKIDKKVLVDQIGINDF